MAKIAQITNELRDWILNTLKTGVNPEAIVNAMVKKGFDPIYAYSTLLRLMSNKAVQTVDNNQGPYVYEPTGIVQKGNIISTSDRDIKVLMKMVKPYILYVENLLNSEECDELIKISNPRLTPSQVYDPVTGVKKEVPGRTSSGAYFHLNENPLVTSIEKRIAEFTNIPVSHGEDLQVLHYKKGEEYKQHYDYFPVNKLDAAKGGQRVGTVLMYLNDVESGGETIFPKIGLSVTPKKGTAIYFHYGNSKGQVDRLSLHSSIPVITGEKWVATKWIRQGEITVRS
jgi:prolyl 4-hydroxylase